MAKEGNLEAPTRPRWIGKTQTSTTKKNASMNSSVFLTFAMGADVA